MAIDRRKHVRKSLRVSVRVRKGFADDAMPCDVLDVCQDGARVQAVDLALPNKFTLIMSANGDITRLCRVIWRQGFTMGVQFVPRPALA